MATSPSLDASNYGRVPRELLKYAASLDRTDFTLYDNQIPQINEDGSFGLRGFTDANGGSASPRLVTLSRHEAMIGVMKALQEHANGKAGNSLGLTPLQRDEIKGWSHVNGMLPRPSPMLSRHQNKRMFGIWDGLTPGQKLKLIRDPKIIAMLNSKTTPSVQVRPEAHPLRKSRDFGSLRASADKAGFMYVRGDAAEQVAKAAMGDEPKPASGRKHNHQFPEYNIDSSS